MFGADDRNLVSYAYDEPFFVLAAHLRKDASQQFRIGRRVFRFEGPAAAFDGGLQLLGDDGFEQVVDGIEFEALHGGDLPQQYKQPH